MKKISSKATWYMKYGFPAIWFGMLFFMFITVVMSGALEKDPTFLIGLVVMAIFGFVLMKKMVWDAVDEVLDGGEYLTVRWRGVEDIIALSNVMNVSASTMSSPPKVTLKLISPGKFGDEVSFFPPTSFTFNPFAKNPVAEELMVRVHQAKRSGAL